MLRHLIFYTFTDVSQERAASIFRVGEYVLLQANNQQNRVIFAALFLLVA
jgi:hypothetical protein